MTENKNFKNLSMDISNKLLNSIYHLRILEDYTDGNIKEEILVKNIKIQIEEIFSHIEECRKLISPLE